MASKAKKKPAKAAGASKAADKRAPSAFEAMVVKSQPKAPAPEPLPWWKRLVGADGAKDKTRVDARQMAELRASVMGELAARNKNEPVSNHPFESVVLPELPASGRAPKRGGGDWLFTAFVCVALVAIVLLLLAGGRGPAGPEGALTQLKHALQRGDDAAFAKVVDLPKVTASAVDQLFGTPVLDLKGIPAAMAVPVSATSATMAQMVKPGLAQQLGDEVRTAVAEKGVYGDGTSLLKRLWLDAGGSHLQWGAPRLTAQDEVSASGEMMVTRDDSGQVAEVVVVTLARDGHRWRVVDLPNLGEVMNRLGHIQASIPTPKQVAWMAKIEPSKPGKKTVAGADIEPAAGPAAAAIMAPAAVLGAKDLPNGAPTANVGPYAERIRVSGIDKTQGDPTAMKLRLVISNHSQTDAHRVVLMLTLADAAGVPLRMVEVEDRAVLKAGGSHERVLDIPVRRHDNIQRMVAELPLSALTVKARVVAVK